jgi:hypothetical protein
LEKKVTDIKIDTASQLEDFLKILAEESVNLSRKTVDENRSAEKEYQRDFVSRIKRDKSRFDEAEDQEPSEESPSPSTAESDPPPAAEKESEKEKVDYYSIRNIINLIRAGDSTKDSEVAEPLEKYIMSDLSDDERILMHTFFSSVADIMNKTGKDPRDPSDPPTSISVSKDSKEKTSTAPDTSQKIVSRPSPQPSSRQSGQEDASPPIQVGSQVKENLRIKVKELMRS